MITDVEAFLKFFDGLNRRAVRDIGSLPLEAETWRPPAGEGENAWDIGEIVGHMAASRMYFADAYVQGEWIATPWDTPTRAREEWLAALNLSAERFKEKLSGTPSDWLNRRVPSLDTPGLSFSAWRLLMMMTEHDVHHRSQVETYAGIMGWPVQHIFGRSAEEVGLKARGPRQVPTT
ncbi:MAG: DinB family protein [Candidatus Dormiibacterota bacterium]